MVIVNMDRGLAASQLGSKLLRGIFSVNMDVPRELRCHCCPHLKVRKVKHQEDK